MEITIKLVGGATMTISHVVDYFVSSKEDEKNRRIKYIVDGNARELTKIFNEDHYKFYNEIIGMFDKIRQIIEED